MNALTRENKLLIAAGGNVLFVITFFFDWRGAGSFGLSGWDALPSPWLMLIVSLAAAAILAADAFGVALPPVATVGAALILSVMNLYITLLLLFEGSAKFGLFLGLIFIAVATAFAAITLREER